MPWMKVDDALHSHPKARRAGLAAMGLWTLAGSWAMSYKTDGFVPAWYVSSHPSGRRHATTLVEAGLWTPSTRDGEDGWDFHDWTDYQPSATDIEADRERARERQRASRARRAAQGGGLHSVPVTGAVTRDRQRDSHHPGPARPDPTQVLPPAGSV